MRKKKRCLKVLSFGLSIVVCVCLCVSSGFDVSAATTYSMLFDDVAAFANATECTVKRTGGNDEMILYLASSQSGGAQDWLVEMFFTDGAGINRLANLDYSKRNHVTWEFRLWGRNQGQYDPNDCYISFDVIYNDAYAIYPSDVKVNPSGYTQIYYDFDLPSYCTDLDYMALYMPFNTALTELNIELYEFTLVSYGDADEIIEQFGSNYSYPSTGGVDDYHNAESGALDQVGSYMADAKDNWAGIGDTMAQFTGGLGAVRSMFNALTSMPFFQVLLMISVAVGSCLLLLGLALSAGKRGR